MPSFTVKSPLVNLNLRQSAGDPELLIGRLAIVRIDGMSMHGIVILFSILKIFFQGEANGMKSQVIPGNFMLMEQPDIQAFDPGMKILITQIRQVHDVNLVNMWQADQGVECQLVDIGVSFLDRFPLGGLFQDFGVFHKTGGQGPESVTGFDGTAAEQYLIVALGVFPDRQATGDDFRILVMNGPAVITDITGKIVAFRYSQCHGLATVTTVFHKGLSV